MKSPDVALNELAKIPRLKLFPHLIDTGLPWANKHDYGNKVSEAQRQTATISTIPIADLHCVQIGVNPKKVAGFIDNPSKIDLPGRRNGNGYTTDMPIVVSFHGKLYLHDGHHRVMALRLLGETSVKARLVKLDSKANQIIAWAKKRKSIH